MVLTEQQIIDLTGGKVRHKAQAKELQALGIPFKPRGDGSLAVSLSAAEKALGGVALSKTKEYELDRSTVA